MADLYKGKIPIIKKDLNEGFIRGTPDESPSFGCIPRDFNVDPVEMRDSPDGMKIISDSDLDAYFDEQEAQESSLEHLYLNNGTPAFEFLDQDGFPDCWGHSSMHAAMLNRLSMNLPPIRFNGVAVATLLKQTNGGWCGLSAKFARENGCPEVGTGPGQWPYQSRKGKDTPELRANMALHKVTEDWYDLGRKEYDQELSKSQLKTLGSTNCPCPVDYNRFGHSICQVRMVRVEPGHYSPLILNTWKGWGYFGLAVLLDMWPDNACGVRSSTPSVA